MLPITSRVAEQRARRNTADQRAAIVSRSHLRSGFHLCYGERSAGRRLPRVLLVVVVLGSNGYLVRHQVRRVETHTELTDHADKTSQAHTCVDRRRTREKRGTGGFTTERVTGNIP